MGKTYPFTKRILIHGRTELPPPRPSLLGSSDHRYDEIELIGLFSGFIHDSEFKLSTAWVNIYTKQSKNLERLALQTQSTLTQHAVASGYTPD
jgi:hypothetical protein